ncbi:protein lifeguard 1-like [Haliotis asinina]|uniref:protein lifeguard 1-like n=1 Tax=Haliotis asinina TaxID=109174 RepID=UPI003531E82C
MSTEPPPPPTYEQVLLETQGDASMDIFTIQHSGARDLGYIPYIGDDERPPPSRQAFLTSPTAEAAPLPQKGTPQASPEKTPALPPEPVLPEAVAAAELPPPPPEPAQAPKPKPKPQPKPKPKPAATPATPSSTSNKTAPKPTGAGTSTPAANPSSKSSKSKEDRRALIRRLYLLLMAIQLAAVASVSIFVFIKPITRWMKKDGLPLLYASIGVFLWAFVVLAIILPTKKKVEGNGLRFIIFAFTYACLLGAVSGHFATYCLLAASVMMGLTYLCVVIFSMKTDITMKKGLIFVTVVLLLVIGAICIGTYFVFGLYKLRDSGIGGAIALVLCELFTVSIQLMLSKDNHGFTKDNPCLAFFNIFSHMKDAIIFGITKILCCAI